MQITNQEKKSNDFMKHIVKIGMMLDKINKCVPLTNEEHRNLNRYIKKKYNRQQQEQMLIHDERMYNTWKVRNKKVQSIKDNPIKYCRYCGNQLTDREFYNKHYKCSCQLKKYFDQEFMHSVVKPLRFGLQIRVFYYKFMLSKNPRPLYEYYNIYRNRFSSLEAFFKLMRDLERQGHILLYTTGGKGKTKKLSLIMESVQWNR